MLFLVFMIFACTERPGRLGLLRRGQWFPVFPASRLLFPAFCLCFPAFHAFHSFCVYGAAWAPWAASPWTLMSCIPCIQIITSCFLLVFSSFSWFSWFLLVRSGLGALDGSDSEKWFGGPIRHQSMTGRIYIYTDGGVCKKAHKASANNSCLGSTLV